MYNIQLRTVDSWNGCRIDSSSQKKPLWYGSPKRKKNNIGKPTENEEIEEKLYIWIFQCISMVLDWSLRWITTLTCCNCNYIYFKFKTETLAYDDNETMTVSKIEQ
jgi:hypothetical protein